MKKTFLILFNILLPVGLFAQANSTTLCPTSFTNIGELLGVFLCFIGSYIIPILFSVAFLYFILNIIETIRKANVEKERKDAQKTLMISIIALFVMVSVWGIVKILSSTLGLGGSFVPQVRCLTDKDGNCANSKK
jgi:heme O synthase-like polyprenyltransferase